MAGEFLIQYVIGSSSYKTLPPAAPVLSPTGSMDDSSPTSSASEPLSPGRAGAGHEAGKQRRRKKKRKGRDEVYDFLDRQENTIAQSDKHGREVEEDEDEEENWEWEIKESGAGGRVKGRKIKSRARLPEEWGAPQPPVSSTATTAAPVGDSGSSDIKAPNSSPSPVLSSASAQILTSFTNHSHASLVTDSSMRSYEPMCVDDFLMSAKDEQNANKEKVATVKPEVNANRAAGAPTTKAISAGDISGSLALMTGDSLSPVSQTFSFLDSVLQTSPGSTPDSQATTPITNTPSHAAAPLKSTLTQASSVPKSTSDLPPTYALSTSPAAVNSTLKTKPFVPSATTLSTASPYKNEAAISSSSNTSPQRVPPSATPLSLATPPPSITSAHSEHLESSSPQLPLLEGW